MTELPTYTTWGDVPDHLKTKTGVKQVGKRRRPHQPIVAYIDTRNGRYGGRYALYDLTACLDARPRTDAQRAAFAETRRRSECQQCYAFPVNTSADGFCAVCQRQCDEQRARRLRIRQWAQHIVAAPWCTLDTETTGLTPGHIVDIAVIDGQTGDVLLDTLLRPDAPIPPDAAAVHGITDDMVVTAPRFHEIQPILDTCLRGRICVIYNRPFDESFLQAAGLPTQNYTLTCAMQSYAEFYGQWSDYYGGWTWQSLGAACQQMHISVNGAHRALADAEATRRLVMALAEA